PAITPSNAPLLLVAHKLGPAFAAGCPCVVRPASKTPLSALSLASILVEAGAPPAAVSVVPCRTELAERLVQDERVKMLSFTGSPAVGWRIRRLAATPRVTLELGGNGAVIVHSDANLDYAAERCAFGGFLRAGQACISVQRLYAHDSVYEEFRAKLLARVERRALALRGRRRGARAGEPLRVRATGVTLRERHPDHPPRLRAARGGRADRQRRQHVPRRSDAVRGREALGPRARGHPLGDP